MRVLCVFIICASVLICCSRYVKTRFGQLQNPLELVLCFDSLHFFFEMFKNWKVRPSNAAYIPTAATVHENLLDEDRERALDSSLDLQQNQPPLLIYWVYI